MSMKWMRYSEDEHNTALRMWKEGATLSEIAHAIGRTRDSVIYHIRTYRSEFPLRQTRVSEEEHQEIVRMRESGASIKRIAYYIGISESTVIDHLQREKRRQEECQTADTPTTETRG